MEMFKLLIRDNSGQDLIEYALMAGFVAVAALAIVPSVATSLGREGLVRAFAAFAALLVLGAVVYRRHQDRDDV